MDMRAQDHLVAPLPDHAVGPPIARGPDTRGAADAPAAGLPSRGLLPGNTRPPPRACQQVMRPTPIGDAHDRGQLHPRSPTTGGSSDVSTKTTKRPDEKKPRTDERPPTALVQQFDDLAQGLEEIINEEGDISPIGAERASSSGATARATATMGLGPGQIVTNFQVGTGLIHQVASNADQVANENYALREALQRAEAMVLNSQREGTLRAEMMAAEVARAQQVAIEQQEAFRQREHEQRVHVQRMVEAEMGALSHRAEAERQAALGQLSSSAQAETSSLVAKLQDEYCTGKVSNKQRVWLNSIVLSSNSKP